MVVTVPKRAVAADEPERRMVDMAILQLGWTAELLPYAATAACGDGGGGVFDLLCVRSGEGVHTYTRVQKSDMASKSIADRIALRFLNLKNRNQAHEDSRAGLGEGADTGLAHC